MPVALRNRLNALDDEPFRDSVPKE